MVRKNLARVVLFVVVLGSAYAMLSLFAPSKASTSQFVVLNESRADVYETISNLETWVKWAPLIETGEIKSTVSGRKGEASQQLKWEGNISGKITLDYLQADSVLKADFTIREGWRVKQGSLEFKLDKVGRNTRLHCTYTQNPKWYLSVINYFKLDSINNQIKQNLNSLSIVLDEKESDVQVGNGISISTLFGVNYATVKSSVLNAVEKQEFIDNTYPNIYSYMRTNGISAQGPPCLFVYYLPGADQGKLAAAIPISQPLQNEYSWVRTAIDSFQVSSSDIQFLHRGSMLSLPNRIEAVSELINGQNWKPVDPIIQEYIVGPMHTDREANYKINVKIPFTE